MESDVGREGLGSNIEITDENPVSSVMEINQSGIENPNLGIENKFSVLDEGSNGVFARERSLFVEKQKSKLVIAGSRVGKKVSVVNEKKLSRQDRIELRKLFQSAVSSHDWHLADRDS